MTHHPANVAGGKESFAGTTVEDVFHAGCQRHHIPGSVALHTFGLAGGAAGVDGVADVGGLHRLARHLRVKVLLAQLGPQMVAAGHQVHGRELSV